MSISDRDVQDTLMIGRRLRELRAGLALTQKEIADRAGLSQGRVSMVERGSSITPLILFRLSRVYGTTTDYLIAGVVPDQQSAA